MPFSREQLLKIFQDPRLTPEERAAVAEQIKTFDAQSKGEPWMQAEVDPEQDVKMRPKLDSYGDQNEAMSNFLKIAATGASMIPGQNLVSTSLRVALPAVLEGASEDVQGNDGWTRMGQEGILGLTGEALSRVIPYAGNAAALASGGGFSRLKETGFNRALGAFNREGRRWRKPILVGTKEKKIQKALEGANKRLQVAEEMNPAKLPSVELGKVNEPFSAEAKNARLPLDLRADNNKFDAETVKQQVIERHPAFAKVKEKDPELALKMWEGKPPGFTAQQWKKMKPGQRKAAQDKWHKKLMSEVELSTRDVGELQRPLRKKSKPVIEARKENEFVAVTPEEAQRNANLMSSLRNWRRNTADVDPRLPEQGMFDKLFDRVPKPGEQGAIKAADSVSSDLHTIKEANDALRSPGAWGDMNLWSVRGALGAGALTTGAFLTGNNPYAWGPLGLPLGVALLNPRTLSGAGWFGGRVAQAAPGGLRGGEVFRELQEAIKEFEENPTGRERK